MASRWISTTSDAATSILDALRANTLGSAYFSHDDHQLGSIEVGKFADLAVLSEDYLDIPEEDIKNLRSVLTLLNGNVVYADPDAGSDSDAL